jgi:hypothetical protein
MSDKSTEQIFWELDAFIKCSVSSPPEDAIQNAHELLAALRHRHAEKEARTCATCRDCLREDDDVLLCELTSIAPDGDEFDVANLDGRFLMPWVKLDDHFYTKCEALGNGCRAWARREP